MLSNWKNTDYNNFRLFSPENIAPKIFVYDIQYDHKDYIIQTPRTSIFSLINDYNSPKICICFYNYEFCQETIDFINNILRIEDMILQHKDYIWSKIDLSPKQKKLNSCIKFNPSKTKAYLYLNIHLDKSRNPILSIFDKNKNLKNIDYIIPQSNAYSIIMLNNVWTKGRQMGLNWTILQTKIYHPITYLNECLIIDDDDINSSLHYHNILSVQSSNIQSIPTINQPTLPPDYDKFAKMKKMGIPDFVIEAKMKLQGLDYNLLQQPSSISNTSPNNLSNKSSISVSSSDLLSAKLKKIDLSTIPTPKIDIKDKIKLPSTHFKPPSNDELLEMLNKLKKV